MNIRKIIVGILYRIIKKQESLSKNYLKKLVGNRRYFAIKSYIEITSVIEKYSKRKIKNKTKRIVLIFNGDVCNPGLADRIRSMSSVYYWCKKNNYEFKIHFSYPFELSTFLRPNMVDWESNAENLDYCIATPKAIISYDRVFGEEENKKLHRQALDDLVSIGYGDIHLYTNTYCYDDYFYESFNELFKIDNLLEKELLDIREKIGGDYITLSFRFTQLLGDLKDSYGSPLPESEREKLIHICLQAIENIVKDNGVSRCVVTSDSASFLNLICNHPMVYIIPGSVGHISSDDVNVEQIRKTFWDMFIISRAKKAFMVRTPIMYKSGFAKRSAMIGDIPFEEVVVQ